MKQYKVGVAYTSFGYVYVDAEDETHLKEKLKNKDVVNALPLPDDPQYVEDSYEIDFEFEPECVDEHLLTNDDLVTIMSGMFTGCDYWIESLEQPVGFEWNPMKGHKVSQLVSDLLVGNDMCIRYGWGERTTFNKESLINGINLAIKNGHWDGKDVSDVDDIVVDCIIQYGAFGKIIYG